jgi:PAS domain S-box-containing protein
MQNDKLQKALEETTDSRNLFQSLYDFAPVGYFIFDKKGKITNVNLTGAKILEIPRNNLVSKLFSQFILNEDLSLFNLHFREIIKKKVCQNTCEIRLRKNNNQWIYVRLDNLLIKDNQGKFSECRSVIIDITKQKFHEDELIKARVEAEKANNFKSVFLANMSHELRSPLNAILGSTQFLKKELYDKYAFLFDNIEISGKMLIDTIHKIVDISRIHTGSFPLTLQKCNISRVITDCINSLEILAKQKNLTIEFQNNSSDIYIWADLYAISHALINILDNAIKYTAKGGVKVKLSRKNKEKVILEVSDSGIGIKKEIINGIFDEFFSPKDGLTRYYDGTGLGLVLAKKFINLCHGTISIKSNKKGTAISILLLVAK